MTAHCRYHCRMCSAHFTSLEAFDAHRVGPINARRCKIGGSLIERVGACKVAGRYPLIRTSVWEHERAGRLRDYRKAENGRQALPTDARYAAVA